MPGTWDLGTKLHDESGVETLKEMSQEENLYWQRLGNEGLTALELWSRKEKLKALRR